MAVSGKIADGVINIALAGLDAAKTQLANLAETAKKVSGQLSTIGATSKIGFATLTASVTGFLAAADPVRMEIFHQKILILGIYIGRIFIPILDDATKFIDKLIAYFASLSSEQMDNIEHWTRIALEVLGVVAGITSFIAIANKAIGVIRAITTVIGLLEAETGIGLVLALAAVAFGVLELTGGMEKLQPIIEKVQKLFSEFMGAILEPFMNLLSELAEQFIGAFQQVAKAVIPLFKSICEVFGSVFAAIKPVIDQLSALFGQFVAELIPAFNDLAAQFQGLVAEFIPILKEMGKAFGDMATLVGGFLLQLLPSRPVNRILQ
jgi:phage-related minor tail protein